MWVDAQYRRKGGFEGGMCNIRNKSLLHMALSLSVSLKFTLPDENKNPLIEDKREESSTQRHC